MLSGNEAKCTPFDKTNRRTERLPLEGKLSAKLTDEVAEVLPC